MSDTDTKALIELLECPWSEPAKNADDEVQKLYKLCQRAAATITRLEAERDAARREAFEECALMVGDMYGWVNGEYVDSLSDAIRAAAQGKP